MLAEFKPSKAETATFALVKKAIRAAIPEAKLGTRADTVQIADRLLAAACSLRGVGQKSLREIYREDATGPFYRAIAYITKTPGDTYLFGIENQDGPDYTAQLSRKLGIPMTLKEISLRLSIVPSGETYTFDMGAMAGILQRAGIDKGLFANLDGQAKKGGIYVTLASGLIVEVSNNQFHQRKTETVRDGVIQGKLHKETLREPEVELFVKDANPFYNMGSEALFSTVEKESAAIQLLRAIRVRFPRA